MQSPRDMRSGATLQSPATRKHGAHRGTAKATTLQSVSIMRRPSASGPGSSSGSLLRKGTRPFLVLTSHLQLASHQRSSQPPVLVLVDTLYGAGMGFASLSILTAVVKATIRSKAVMWRRSQTFKLQASGLRPQVSHYSVNSIPIRDKPLYKCRMV